MRKLAFTIRDRIDTLVEESALLLPETERSTFAVHATMKSMLEASADSLETGDTAPFLRLVHDAMGRGNTSAQMDQALSALEQTLAPLVETTATALFLWRLFSRSRAEISRLTARPELEQLVSRLPVGVFRTTVEGQIVEANPAFLKIVGYDSLEAINRVGVPALYQNPADRERMLARLHQRPVVSFETVFRRSDGHLVPVSITVRTSTAVGRDTHLLEGIVEDITARRRVESELRRLSRAVEATHDVIFITDVEGRIRFVNQAFEQVTGYTHAEALGQNPRILKSGQHSDDLYADMWRTVVAGKVWQGDMINRRKDGTLYEAQLTISPVHNEAGEVEQFIAVQHDVTEQRRVDAALRESEEKFRSLVESAHTGIFIANDDYQVTYVNDELCRILGRTRDELIGFDLHQVLDEESLPVVAERSVRRQGGDDVPPRYEFVIRRKNGEERYIEVSVAALRDIGGRMQTMGHISDITDRKRLELAMRASLERRARQVQTGTEVAQEIASAPALDELFRRVVTLIKERFDYYHAQIFRYEPALDAVVLVTGYGETGAAMLTEGHRLVMGRGVVGTAAATGRPVLAADVTQDEDWVPNPHLPETKGELAVPIKLGDEVLGILDVQSRIAAALTEEDQLLLEGLCGQIAIAIQNTRLRQEMEEHLRELEHLTRTMSREGWETFRRAAGPTGYLFDQTDLIPAGDLWTPEIGLAMEKGSIVLPASDEPAAVAPLTVRGEIIGVLGVRDDSQHPLSQDELVLVENVSEQVALALESARLFEQAQTMLEQTDALYHISRALNTATNYDQIIEALKHHPLVRRASRGGMGLFNRPLAVDSTTYLAGDDMPEWIDMIASWRAPDLLPIPGVSTRYELDTFPVVRYIRSDEPFCVENIADDPRLDDNTRQLYLNFLQTRSMVFVPLVAGDRWIGWLNVLMSEPGSFPDDQLQSLMALAGQAAVTVRNLRHLEDIQTRARREQALRGITAALSASENMDDLVASLPAIVEHLRQMLPVDLLTLAAYSPGEFDYTLYATGMKTEAGHLSRRGVRLPVTGTCPGWVITHREPWLEGNLRREMLFSEDEQLAAEGMVSRLALPLQVGEQVVGAINVASRQPDAFTQEHVSSLLPVAAQMALALERSRLLEETRSALAEVEATHRAYLQRGWRDYLRQRETLRRGAFLYDRTRGAAVLDGLTEPVSDLWLPEMKRALSEGAPAMAEDGGAGRTGLAIPIVLRGQTIGVLGVEDPDGRRRWSEDDRFLIESVGRQLAQALENARLLGETQLRAQRERIIGDVTGRVRASMDLESILKTAVRELGVALGTDRAFIKLGEDIQSLEKEQRA